MTVKSARTGKEKAGFFAEAELVGKDLPATVTCRAETEAGAKAKLKAYVKEQYGLDVPAALYPAEASKSPASGATEKGEKAEKPEGKKPPKEKAEKPKKGEKPAEDEVPPTEPAKDGEKDQDSSPA